MSELFHFAWVRRRMTRNNVQVRRLARNNVGASCRLKRSTDAGVYAKKLISTTAHSRQHAQKNNTRRHTQKNNTRRLRPTDNMPNWKPFIIPPTVRSKTSPPSHLLTMLAHRHASSPLLLRPVSPPSYRNPPPDIRPGRVSG